MFLSAACIHVVMSCVRVLFCTWLVICFAGHVLFFVLCEHMALVLVFCVPCALMSIVLTPPILFVDYWLICPICFSIVTLLICSLYNLLVFAVLCQFVVVHRMYPAPPRPAPNWPTEDSAEMGIFLFPSPTTGLSTRQILAQHINSHYFRQQGADVREFACDFFIEVDQLDYSASL